MKKILISMGLFGLLGAVALAGYFYEKNTAPVIYEIQPAANQNTAMQTDTAPKPSEPSATIAFYQPIPWSSGEVLKGRGETYLREEWLSLNKGQESIQNDEESMRTFIQDVINASRYWKTGTFQSGHYTGQTLVTARIGCLGPCQEHSYRFAVDEKNDIWTLLFKYSYYGDDYLMGIHRPVDAVDKTLTISAFEVPKELSVYPNSKVVLSEAVSMMDPRLEAGPEIGITGAEDISYTGGHFSRYFYVSNCLFGVMPDGVSSKYSVVPDEFVKTPTAEDPNPFSIEKEFVFTDLAGKSETKIYTIQSGGCGIGVSGCPQLLTPASGEASELVKIGTLGNEDAYSFASISDGPDDDTYMSLQRTVRLTYDGYVMQREYDETLKNEKLLSIDEFLAQHKVLFLKLDNGKYLGVFEKGYNQPAECGKPVIYLYPEKKTLVNVEVGVDKLTKTIPAYGENGWTVMADPSGTLYNPSDKTEYPYLFWEGLSDKKLNSLAPWTTKKSEVSIVLPKVLHDLGLRGTEISDFMEFWGPRILGEKAPYIEFSFVEQKVFDKIAPLAITPKPDTVIRIFMVYHGTNEMGFSVPKYSSVPRNGFTVIEWGGALK